jgi:uncharacterized protein YegP (UPF0339 family)
MLTIDKVLNVLRGTYKITVTKVTVYNWIMKGRNGQTLAASKTDDGYQVKIADLKAWIASNTAAALRKGRGRPVAVSA